MTGWPPAGYAFDAAVREAQACLPLSQREVGWFDPTRVDESPGKRLRTFATLVRPLDGNVLAVARQGNRQPYILAHRRRLAYGEALRAIERSPHFQAARDDLAMLPLRVGDYPQLHTEIPQGYERTPRDPDLHPALQDLADEINEDLHEAMDAFDNPSIYFAGVDSGIEPVSDEHVKLVIWAMQRELDRELRPGSGSGSAMATLPAAPLTDLPWNVQRALAERRRLRFAEWGIGREQWLSGTWSLWEVPADPDWTPRRSRRLAA
jgi:hypothetical protein